MFEGVLPPVPTALISLFVTTLGRDIIEDKTDTTDRVDDDLPSGMFI